MGYQWPSSVFLWISSDITNPRCGTSFVMVSWFFRVCRLRIKKIIFPAAVGAVLHSSEWDSGILVFPLVWFLLLFVYLPAHQYASVLFYYCACITVIPSVFTQFLKGDPSPPAATAASCSYILCTLPLRAEPCLLCAEPILRWQICMSPITCVSIEWILSIPVLLKELLSWLWRRQSCNLFNACCRLYSRNKQCPCFLLKWSCL